MIKQSSLLDKRSLFVGFVIGSLVTLGVAATNVVTTASEPGRYQAVISDNDGKVVVIDTTNGQVWRGLHQGIQDANWNRAK